MKKKSSFTLSIGNRLVQRGKVDETSWHKLLDKEGVKGCKYLG